MARSFVSLRLLLACMTLSGSCRALLWPHCHASKAASFALDAKKKRRRKGRKHQPNSPAPPPAGGDLPDFDLEEEMVERQTKMSAAKNPDEITPNMMGGQGTSVRSVSELIQDRSLESKFEFEEAGDDALPDLVDAAKRMASDAPRGKLRKTKKIGKAETENEETNMWPLKRIEFIKGSDGDVDFVKVSGRKLLLFWPHKITSHSYGYHLRRFWSLGRGWVSAYWLYGDSISTRLSSTAWHLCLLWCFDRCSAHQALLQSSDALGMPVLCDCGIFREDRR